VTSFVFKYQLLDKPYEGKLESTSKACPDCQLKLTCEEK
jgi:hypothetical protein